MIQFIHNDRGEVVKSYAEVARELLESPVGDVELDFVTSIILFMDYLDKEKRLRVRVMKPGDWKKLEEATRIERMRGEGRAA